jgi:hypothetical protein
MVLITLMEVNAPLIHVSKYYIYCEHICNLGTFFYYYRF